MRIVLGSWIALGAVRLDTDGRLMFPPPPRAPGLYRYRIDGPEASVYLGETDDFARRFGHYRNPGPSQRTNVRMNDRMVKHLRAGGGVSVEVCTQTTIEVGGQTEPLDLARRSHRVLAEEEAVAEARRGRMGHVENLRV